MTTYLLPWPCLWLRACREESKLTTCSPMCGAPFWSPGRALRPEPSAGAAGCVRQHPLRPPRVPADGLKRSQTKAFQIKRVARAGTQKGDRAGRPRSIAGLVPPHTLTRMCYSSGWLHGMGHRLRTVRSPQGPSPAC